MIGKNGFRFFLILSLAAVLFLSMTGIGICAGKPLFTGRIDLSKYNVFTSRTFKAYRYNFMPPLTRVEGTLKFIITPFSSGSGFTLRWDEEWPVAGGGGFANYSEMDYESTYIGTFETQTRNYSFIDTGGNLTRGPQTGESFYEDVSGDPVQILSFPNGIADVGYTWGNALIVKSAPPSSSSFSYWNTNYHYTLLGLEDVTVPAGFYPDCVKFLRNSYGNTIYKGPRIGWYAIGVGPVKYWYFDGRVFVLESLD